MAESVIKKDNKYPNWSNVYKYQGNVDYTFAQDGYFNCMTITNNATLNVTWTLDTVQVSTIDNASIGGGTLQISIANGYARKGQRLQGIGVARIYDI